MLSVTTGERLSLSCTTGGCPGSSQSHNNCNSEVFSLNNNRKSVTNYHWSSITQLHINYYVCGNKIIFRVTDIK